MNMKQMELLTLIARLQEQCRHKDFNLNTLLKFGGKPIVDVLVDRDGNLTVETDTGEIT